MKECSIINQSSKTVTRQMLIICVIIILSTPPHYTLSKFNAMYRQKLS